MIFPLYIAKRYLFSKKSHNIINIISAISVLGVMIATMALIIVLSIFNGLEDLVGTLYSTFDSDISISAKNGKTFNNATFPYKDIQQLKGVVSYSDVLEETVLLKYREKQYLATLKGVNDDFIRMCRLDKMIIEGKLILKEKEIDYAVLGLGVANNLTVSLSNQFDPIYIYVPRRSKNVILNPEKAFNKMGIYPSGIFSINQDFDTKYIIVPFSFASKILEYEKQISAIEIDIDDALDVREIKNSIQQIIGDGFVIKTRREKNEIIFKTNQTEKWMTYLILSFILIIATFNVIGSLSMLILDKKQDIRIFRSLGADSGLIKKIFFTEGILINIIGGIGGLLLGAILCIGQQYFGFVKLDGGVVDYYPVSLESFDFIAVFLTVIMIGIVASWYPHSYMARRIGNEDIDRFL